MSGILVDQIIAIRGEEYTSSGVLIRRYDGHRIDDKGLVDVASSQGFRALVLVTDGYLVEDELLERAKAKQVTIVVSPMAHPLEAANRVRHYAEELVRSEDPVIRLLAGGPEPIG